MTEDWQGFLRGDRHAKLLPRATTGRLLDASPPAWARGLLVGNIGFTGAHIGLWVGRGSFAWPGDGFEFDLGAGAFEWISASFPVMRVDVKAVSLAAQVGAAWTREPPRELAGSPVPGAHRFVSVPNLNPINAPVGGTWVTATVDDALLVQSVSTGVVALNQTSPVGPTHPVQPLWGDVLVPSVAPNTLIFGIRLP